MNLRLGGRFSAGEAVVRARGDFNAANATAALAATQLIGAVAGPRVLAEYPGVRRRQAVLSTGGGLTVIEDYAHHPTEIRALLGSLRRRLGTGGRLIVVFQPHRFSRTAQFKAEFAAALALADRVHLLDVYPAGEAPLPGGTTADIYAEIKRSSGALPVDYLPGGGAGAVPHAGARGPPRRLGRLCRGGRHRPPGPRRAGRAAAAAAAQARRWDDFAAAVRPRARRGQQAAARGTPGAQDHARGRRGGADLRRAGDGGGSAPARARRSGRGAAGLPAGPRFQSDRARRRRRRAGDFPGP